METVSLDYKLVPVVSFALRLARDLWKHPAIGVLVLKASLGHVQVRHGPAVLEQHRPHPQRENTVTLTCVGQGDIQRFHQSELEGKPWGLFAPLA